ncbi:hypothetical protein M9H77_34145 [Catharanthus roseus]|uniref:Uncharacterized protein n=1 Tax=Catharanthus roseus TaxID=4058 RepID=A0ACB9ZKN1_CATRO|nr:hypothetical protein M9H77_34145 [Catharanthus roseus]
MENRKHWIVFLTGNFHGIRANCLKSLIMSHDNIGNVDNDMVEESHVRRIKKDGTILATPPAPASEQTEEHLFPNSIVHIARRSDTTSPAASSWWDIRSGGCGVHLNPVPVAGLCQRATAEDGAAGAASTRDGRRTTAGPTQLQSGVEWQRQKLPAAAPVSLRKKTTSGRDGRRTTAGPIQLQSGVEWQRQKLPAATPVSLRKKTTSGRAIITGRATVMDRTVFQI